MTKRVLVLLLTGVMTSVVMGGLKAVQQATTNVQNVFTLRQPSAHRGRGAALSDDGRAIVYVGADGALHITDIVSRTDRVLLKVVGGLIDTFYEPRFSPDGTSVAFAADGGTDSYKSEIYSVRTDGTGLRQLTVSSDLRVGGHPAEHFYTAKYSPDGSQILVWQNVRGENDTEHDFSELMASDGTGRVPVAEGQPLGWSANGRAIYVSRESEVLRVDLSTRVATPVPGLTPPILGRRPDAGLPLDDDVLVVGHESSVGFVTVQNGIASAPTLLPFPVRKRLDATPATGRRDDLRLRSMQFDRTGDRALLQYEADPGVDETLEVVNVRNLGR